MKVGRITQLTHTPGPWHVEHQSTPSQHHATGGDPVLSVYAGGVKIAALATADRADAAVLAAAPDLLAALKRIVAMYGPSSDYSHEAKAAWKVCEAAIAKAEGGA